MSFFEPSLPWIIVQKLTKEIIEEAIKFYLEDKADAYFLKLYHFATNIDLVSHLLNFQMD